MYRPACRISQIGVYGTGSRLQARMKTLSFSVTFVMLLFDSLTLDSPVFNRSL
jgi:hypothetical protein